MSIWETCSVTSTNNISLRSSKGQFLNSSMSLQNLSLTKHAECILCITDYIPLKPFHQEKYLLKAKNRWTADFNRLLKSAVKFSHLNLGSTVVRTQLQFSVHFLHAKFYFLLILTANVLMSNNFLSPSLSPLNFNYRLHSKRLIFVHGWELKRWPSVHFFFLTVFPTICSVPDKWGSEVPPYSVWGLLAEELLVILPAWRLGSWWIVSNSSLRLFFNI